jgi:hypothetical protein
VLLDGLAGHEQRLCDIDVAEAASGHLRDAALAEGECVDTAEPGAARARADRCQFVSGALSQERGAAAVG